MKNRSKKTVKPLKISQTPATKEMLSQMEDRLIHRMDGVKAELRSEIHAVKAEVQEVRSEIHSVKAEVQEVKSEIQEVKAEIHGFKSEMRRVALLVEEQNSRNKFVMDGYAQIYDLLTLKRET